MKRILAALLAALALAACATDPSASGGASAVSDTEARKQQSPFPYNSPHF